MTGREHEKTSSKIFVNAAGGLIAAIAFAMLTGAWHKWSRLIENAGRYQEVYSFYSHFPTFLVALFLSILAPILAILLIALFAVLFLTALMGVVESGKTASKHKDFFTYNTGLYLGVLTPFAGYAVYLDIPATWHDAVFIWTK